MNEVTEQIDLVVLGAGPGGYVSSAVAGSGSRWPSDRRVLALCRAAGSLPATIHA